MTAALAIRLRGVGKRYTRFEDTPALATGLRHVLRGTRRGSLWAVRDVDLDVTEGECLGLIGRNGSGKSTLLQLLCGVTAPTTGEVRVRGRTAPLISVGVGFHPELTGRENVLVNGAILGMSRAEVHRKLDAIVDFSGVEEFLDTPTKFYSSGMVVRLGFAVAVHADPDVLLVDEVLAVGDLAFQIRSFERMEALRDAGTTLVVVSHDLHSVQRLCPRTVVIDGGRPVFDGPTSGAVSVYHDVLAAGAAPEGAAKHEAGRVVVHAVELLDAADVRTSRLTAGDSFRVRVDVEARHDLDAPFVVVQVRSADGIVVYSDTNALDPYPPLRAGERATWQVELSSRLASGTYTLSVEVGRAAPGTDLPLDRLLADIAVLASPAPVLFYVSGRAMVHGVADLGGRFGTVDPDDRPRSNPPGG
ncbi:MAG: ABC transporter ATP-binding protein [Actinomycetes bacterium]